MTWWLFLAVGFGGFIGAPSRYLLDRFVSTRFATDFPWGTFIINASGSLLLGFLTGLFLVRRLPVVVDAFAGVGYCGAYTTFSTFSFETVQLLEGGQVLEALANVALSLVVGLGAATAGIALGLAV